MYSLGKRKIQFEGEPAFIAPNASLIGSIVIHENVSIWFNVVIRADNDKVIIEENTNIQDGSVLHITSPDSYGPDGFALTIGNNVTVGHRVVLHGCTIHDRVLVGVDDDAGSSVVRGRDHRIHVSGDSA